MPAVIHSLKSGDVMKKFLAILLVMVVLVAGCSRAPEAPAPVNPESIAEAFFKASNSGDVEKCLGLIADDIIVNQDPPGVTTQGKTQYEIVLKESTRLHRQYSITTPYKVEGDKVTVEAKVTGDDFRSLGMDSISVRYTMQVREDKIIAISSAPNSADWAELMRRTGSPATSRPPVATQPAPTVDLSSDFASYDVIIQQLMAKWGVPGASIAVAKDGKLVLAKGYGIADREKNLPVRPESLLRIASISKPITAVAVLKLVEEGKLQLEDKVFSFLGDIKPPAGKTPDPRIYDITVRQLLQHSGGWDRDKSFDPMFSVTRVAEELGAPKPVSSETIIRYMLGQPLDFEPGSRYAYSNFGYCVLGWIIEKVTGQSYYDYVTDKVLRPAGVNSMRLGKSRENDRYENEVRYYDYEGAPRMVSVFPDSPPVPAPYGGFCLEAMDAHGGWVATATDLLRFVISLDEGKLLKPETLALMISRPAMPLWQDSSYYYGMGWMVRPDGNDANWWHTGSLPGTYSIVVRTSNGFVWTALFNTRPKDENTFAKEVDQALWDAYSGVNSWPAINLFAK